MSEHTCAVVRSYWFDPPLAAARREDVGARWLNSMTALSAFGQWDHNTAAAAFDAFANTRSADGSPAPFAALDSAVLGNSAEQRDVLDEVYIMCLLNCERVHEAQTIILNRMRVRVEL